MSPRGVGKSHESDRRVIAPVRPRSRSSRSTHHLPKLLQQRLRLDEVTCVKALGEPGIDGRQQRAGLDALALALPEAREAGRGAQLEGLRLLRARDVERAAEERLGFRGVRRIGVEEQLAFEVVESSVA